LRGHNIIERLDSKVCNWYSGPCFIEVLDTLELPNRDPDGPVRIPVLDKIRDRGIFVFGKVESGTVRMTDKLTLMPNNIEVTVINVYNSKDEAVRFAKPGENVKLRLKGIEDENTINKGDVLCIKDLHCPISNLFEVEITILQLLEHKPIITQGYQCILHIHTVADECTINEILSEVKYNEKGEAKEVKSKPKYGKTGQIIVVRMSTRIPVCIEKFSTISQMGRFTLRDESQTIALGKILRYKPFKGVIAMANEFKKTEETKEETKEEVIKAEPTEREEDEDEEVTETAVKNA